MFLRNSTMNIGLEGGSPKVDFHLCARFPTPSTAAATPSDSELSPDVSCLNQDCESPSIFDNAFGQQQHSRRSSFGISSFDSSSSTPSERQFPLNLSAATITYSKMPRSGMNTSQPVYSNNFNAQTASNGMATYPSNSILYETDQGGDGCVSEYSQSCSSNAYDSMLSQDSNEPATPQSCRNTEAHNNSNLRQSGTSSANVSQNLQQQHRQQHPSVKTSAITDQAMLLQTHQQGMPHQSVMFPLYQKHLISQTAPITDSSAFYAATATSSLMDDCIRQAFAQNQQQQQQHHQSTSSSTPKRSSTSGRRASMASSSSGGSALPAVVRDIQRKRQHNEIEKRRRSNINERITELANLLPSCSDPDFRLHKGNILCRVVDYIRNLQPITDQLTTIQVENKHLAAENAALRRQLQGLMEVVQGRQSSSGSTSNLAGVFAHSSASHQQVHMQNSFPSTAQQQQLSRNNSANAAGVMYLSSDVLTPPISRHPSNHSRSTTSSASTSPTALHAAPTMTIACLSNYDAISAAWSASTNTAGGIASSAD